MSPSAVEATLTEWMPPLPEGLQRAADALAEYPLLAAGSLVVFFYLLAKLTEFLLVRGIKRFTRKTVTDLDDAVVDRLHRPIFLTVFFAGLALAVLHVVELSWLRKGSLSVLATILIFVWLVALMRIFRLLLDALGRNRERFPLLEERTIPLFDITAKVLLVGGASYLALITWGINPTAWLASAGVIGIAVGFAAKDTLANLFAGFFIVADAPYKLGDFIILDSGERGRVTHVGIRSTRLLTRDDIEITLPNAIMANAKIINESGGPWEKERIRIKVSAAYGSDVDKVVAVLEALAKEHAHICPEPAPRVRFRTFGESGLDFELLCWIDEPVLRGKLSHEMNMDVYKAFQREGIEIPDPKRDLYIKEMPAGRREEG
jgi:small-conductance mechanosensitive channel